MTSKDLDQPWMTPTNPGKTVDNQLRHARVDHHRRYHRYRRYESWTELRHGRSDRAIDNPAQRPCRRVRYRLRRPGVCDRGNVWTGGDACLAGPVFLALKIAGGLYLLYLGVRPWMASNGDHAADVAVPPTGRVFATALLTQLSNPKTIVVYGSVFATALPLHSAPWLLIALPVAVTAVEARWYLIVATVMSRSAPRRAYLRGAKVDRPRRGHRHGRPRRLLCARRHSARRPLATREEPRRPNRRCRVTCSSDPERGSLHVITEATISLGRVSSQASQ